MGSNRIYKIIALLTLFSSFIIFFSETLSAQESRTEYRIQVKSQQGWPLSRMEVQKELGLDIHVREYYYKGFYTYTVGAYAHYPDAIKARDYLRNNKGISHAFIVKYVNRKRVSFDAGIEPMEVPSEIEVIENLPSQKGDELSASVDTSRLSNRDTATQAKSPAPVETIEQDTTSMEITKSNENDGNGDTNRKLFEGAGEKNWLSKAIIRLVPSHIIRKNTTLFIYAYKNPFIFFLIFLIIYFFLSSVFVILIVIFSRIIKGYQKAKRLRLEDYYHNAIADYLFGSEENAGLPRKIFKRRTNFHKQVITDVIVRLNVSIEGDAALHLRELFFYLGLDRYANRMLKRRKWHIKSKAFYIMANMDVHDAMASIRKYLNSNNDELRASAQTAVVRLNKEDPFDFLNHLTSHFTLWDQLTVHAVVQKYEIEVPAFSRYLDSDNETVIIFALKMIIIYRQMDGLLRIKKLLYHESKQLREQAIQAVGELSFTSLGKDLIRIFSNEDYKNRLLIIRALQRIPDDAYLIFYKQVLDSEAHFLVKLKAAKAMYNLSEEGRKQLLMARNRFKPELDSLYDHVTDLRI